MRISQPTPIPRQHRPRFGGDVVGARTLYHRAPDLVRIYEPTSASDRTHWGPEDRDTLVTSFQQGIVDLRDHIRESGSAGVSVSLSTYRRKAPGSPEVPIAFVRHAPTGSSVFTTDNNAVAGRIGTLDTFPDRVKLAMGLLEKKNPGRVNIYVRPYIAPVTREMTHFLTLSTQRTKGHKVKGILPIPWRSLYIYQPPGNTFEKVLSEAHRYADRMSRLPDTVLEIHAPRPNKDGVMQPAFAVLEVPETGKEILLKDTRNHFDAFLDRLEGISRDVESGRIREAHDIPAPAAELPGPAANEVRQRQADEGKPL